MGSILPFTGAFKGSILGLELTVFRGFFPERGL